MEISRLDLIMLIILVLGIILLTLFFLTDTSLESFFYFAGLFLTGIGFGYILITGKSS